MNFFRPFRAYRPYKLFGAGGAGGALPSFRAFTYDPSTYELLNYHSGEGDVETDRVAPINVPDADGVYREIPGGQIAYPGARMVLDPAKLFFSGVTTASSPDPLVNLRTDFNDESTWGIDFGAFYTNGIASGVTVTQDGIPIGSTIEMFAGDASTLTIFYCHNNQLTGSIPDLSSNTVLTTFHCHLNQLTGEIPDLSSNIALTTFRCYSNQLTGEIPDLSSNIALELFYCHLNQLTGVSAGWAWPTGRSMNFNLSSNALTVDAVNTILVAADTALSTGAGTTINLSGGTNAAPTGAGATAKASLISKGASVTTN